MTTDLGEYFRLRAKVISGHDARKPDSNALYIVDRVGFPSAPYKKATLSAMIVYSVMWIRRLEAEFEALTGSTCLGRAGAFCTAG